MSYIGRFAPSPTGPMHFGSLIAATASYLDARKAKGTWLVRMEDVDTQRCRSSHARSILDTLETFGFEWDGEIVYQSKRQNYYQQALDAIKTTIYACSCTRKELNSRTGSGKFAYLYPGLCRDGPQKPNASRLSIRVRTDARPICFEDRCQGNYCQSIEKQVGDFILRRSDGLFSYQLAVVVDDALQAITHVVRGADLFDNTPRQIYLQHLLGYSTPTYLHFPVAVTRDGKKLSKQNQAPAIDVNDNRQRQRLLINALHFLGQKVDRELLFAKQHEFWSWAIEHWDASQIPKQMKIQYE